MKGKTLQSQTGLKPFIRLEELGPPIKTEPTLDLKAPEQRRENNAQALEFPGYTSSYKASILSISHQGDHYLRALET